MPERKFEGILCALIKHEDDKMLKILQAILKEVQWPKNKNNISISTTKLPERGSQNQLIAILQIQQMDVALSILSNCIVDRDHTWNLVRTYNILADLNQLLKHYTKEDFNDKIVGIIGKICKYRDSIDEKEQILSYIVEFIKEVSTNEISEGENICKTTVMKTIRILSVLLNCQTLATLVKIFGVLKALGPLFNYYSLKCQENKKNGDVLINIGSLFQDYTRYYRSNMEMRNIDQGISLMHSRSVLVPKRVAKTIMSFIQIRLLKSELPITEICDIFLDVLENYPVVKEFNGECVEFLQCLCYLLEHPANRNSERCSRSVPLLIQLLNDFQDPSNASFECCILIIATLNKCYHDDNLLLEQIKCNILPIILKKLQWTVGSSTTLNIDHKHVKKRMLRFSPSSDDFCSEYDYDYQSLICSEIDNSEFPLSLQEEDIEISCNSGYPIEISKFEEEQTSEHINRHEDLTLMLLAKITELLNGYSRLHPSVPQLASGELLMALLKCSENFEWTFLFNVDTVELICDILDSQGCLIMLMQTEFIQTVYDLTELPERQRCLICFKYSVIGQRILQKFTNFPNSNIVKSVITKKLKIGDNETKEKLVLVIPYIINDNFTLGRLMLHCGGLEIFMKLLEADTDLQRRTIKVLYVMASKKLEIANPKDGSAGLKRRKVVADEYRLDKNCSNIVTFKLDDGTFLKADRDFLSKKSDFFNILLNGSFIESTQDIISLHNADSKPLRCLLHLLQYVNKSEIVEIDLDLDTLLGVIVLSHRYLLTDLCACLTDSVERFKISPDTVPFIYQWSLESGTNLLRMQSVIFALVENVEAERMKMFENLFALGYLRQLIQDIWKVLVRYLTFRMLGTSFPPLYQVEVR